MKVIYLDNLGNEQTENMEIKCIKHYISGYDSDSEEDYNRTLQSHMIKTARRGNKTLYENNEWKITNQDKQKQYMNFALTYAKTLDNVIKIYKDVFCIER